MYEKINITENALRVLSLFTDGFEREYYIREIQKILNISPRTSQLILENLEEKGILISKTKGKIKAYVLNPTEFTKRYLVFVEQYKALSFLDKRLMVKEIIEKISPHIKGIGIIFGSYVKQLETEKSDLDVFVAGSYTSAEIDKVSQMYGIEVSVKCYPLKIFEKNIRKDILLREVLKNHVVFLHTEQFIEGVFNEK